jgi:hypothetical protein
MIYPTSGNAMPPQVNRKRDDYTSTYNEISQKLIPVNSIKRGHSKIGVPREILEKGINEAPIYMYGDFDMKLNGLLYLMVNGSSMAADVLTSYNKTHGDVLVRCMMEGDYFVPDPNGAYDVPLFALDFYKSSNSFYMRKYLKYLRGKTWYPACLEKPNVFYWLLQNHSEIAANLGAQWQKSTENWQGSKPNVKPIFIDSMFGDLHLNRKLEAAAYRFVGEQNRMPRSHLWYPYSDYTRRVRILRNLVRKAHPPQQQDGGFLDGFLSFNSLKDRFYGPIKDAFTNVFTLDLKHVATEVSRAMMMREACTSVTGMVATGALAISSFHTFLKMKSDFSEEKKGFYLYEGSLAFFSVAIGVLRRVIYKIAPDYFSHDDQSKIKKAFKEEGLTGEEEPSDEEDTGGFFSTFAKAFSSVRDSVMELRFVSVFVRAMKDFKTIIDAIAHTVRYIVEWLMFFFTGKESLYVSCVRRIDGYIDDVENLMVVETHDLPWAFKTVFLHKLHDELIRDLTKVPSLMRVKRPVITKVAEWFQKNVLRATQMLNAQSTIAQPVGFAMFGPPGTGKSEAVKNLCRLSLSTFYGRVVSPIEFSNLNWPYHKDGRFDDGAIGTEVSVTIDDAFKSGENGSEENVIDYTTMHELCSGAPYYLTKAGVNEKDKLCIQPKVVGVASNMDYSNWRERAQRTTDTLDRRYPHKFTYSIKSNKEDRYQEWIQLQNGPGCENYMEWFDEVVTITYASPAVSPVEVTRDEVNEIIVRATKDYMLRDARAREKYVVQDVDLELEEVFSEWCEHFYPYITPKVKSDMEMYRHMMQLPPFIGDLSEIESDLKKAFTLPSVVGSAKDSVGSFVERTVGKIDTFKEDIEISLLGQVPGSHQSYFERFGQDYPTGEPDDVARYLFFTKSNSEPCHLYTGDFADIRHLDISYLYPKGDRWFLYGTGKTLLVSTLRAANVVGSSHYVASACTFDVENGDLRYTTWPFDSRADQVRFIQKKIEIPDSPLMEQGSGSSRPEVETLDEYEIPAIPNVYPSHMLFEHFNDLYGVLRFTLEAMAFCVITGLIEFGISKLLAPVPGEQSPRAKKHKKPVQSPSAQWKDQGMDPYGPMRTRLIKLEVLSNPKVNPWAFVLQANTLTMTGHEYDALRKEKVTVDYGRKITGVLGDFLSVRCEIGNGISDLVLVDIPGLAAKSYVERLPTLEHFVARFRTARLLHGDAEKDIDLNSCFLQQDVEVSSFGGVTRQWKRVLASMPVSPTDRGDCGRIIVSTCVNKYNAPLGIHIAGNGMEAMCAPFIKEDIVAGLAKLRSLGIAGGRPMMSQGALELYAQQFIDGPMTEEQMVYQGPFVPVGLLEPTMIPHAPSSSKIRRSKLTLQEPMQGIPTLGFRNTDYLSKKWAKPVSFEYDFSSMKYVANQRVSHYPSPSEEFSEVLTVEQAVVGIPDTKFPGVAVSKSPGYQMNMMKRSMGSNSKGKRPYFRLFEDGSYDLSKLLYDAVEELENIAQSHEPVPCIYQGVEKDERLLLTDLENAKVRLIVVGGFAYLVLMRMYFGAFFEAIVRSKDYSSFACQVGISPLRGGQMEKLFNDLKDFSKSIMEVDFSGWDKYTSYELHYYCITLINLWYNKHYGVNSHLNAVRTAIYSGVVYNLVVIKNTVVIMVLGTFSGNPGTSNFNSVMHDGGAYMVLYDYLLDNHVAMVHDDYSAMFRTKVYGDDGLYSCRLPNFTQPVFAKRFQLRFGMFATPAGDKHADFEDFMEIDDVSFLKRSFQLVDGEIRGCLHKEVIREMCMWYRTSASPYEDEATRQNCESALREAFLWGEEYFGELNSEIKGQFEKLGWEPPNLTYRGLFAQYWDGGLDPTGEF